MRGNLGPLCEEPADLRALFCVQCRESGKRLAYGAIERWRDAPDAAVAVGPLFKLVELIFLYAIGRVGDNSVD